MKVFITGHTSGIGLATFNLLQQHNYNVVGGSRSNNWDISNTDNYADVLDFDVLINNATCKLYQTELLKYTYSYWKNKQKTIINIGSAHTRHQIGRPYDRLDYNVNKAALEQYSNWIYENDKNCRSMMYNPGFVDTPLARTGMDKWPLTDQKQVLERAMDPATCAETIKFMIENKNSFREVTHG